MANLLYYPYINLPKTDWTLRTLMYYDTVGSIVPRSYFHNPQEYDPFMLELVRAGLVVPIDPIETIDHPVSAIQPFLELITRNEGKLKMYRKAFGKELKNYKSDQTLVPYINENKFDVTVFEHLMELGLAEYGKQGWFIVESKTANNLMKFLATVVAAKTNRMPVTDQIRSFSYKKTDQKLQEKRETILQNLMPYPAEIDLDGLMRFKDRFSGLAESFRIRVEQIVHDPNIIEGTAQFHYRMAEMMDQKEELVARMKETRSFPQIFFGSVCGIISGGATLFDPNPISVMGTLAGFGSAVYSALQIERAENVIDQSGMKYLALADYKLRR